jgi:hypothetical protein
VNVTAYTPGRSAVRRYRPWSSVVTVRVRSINDGLVTSTVTPGSAPPDESRTRPTIAPVDASCADAETDINSSDAQISRTTNRCILMLLCPLTICPVLYACSRHRRAYA